MTYPIYNWFLEKMKDYEAAHGSKPTVCLMNFPGPLMDEVSKMEFIQSDSFKKEGFQLFGVPVFFTPTPLANGIVFGESTSL